MTHMTAMARGWDVKNDPDDSHKFSPKWTYNWTFAKSQMALEK